MKKITQAYEKLVVAGEIVPDEAQYSVLPKLDALQFAVEARAKKTLFRKSPVLPLGLYIWGGVGTGKSFLMDLFVGELKISVRRVHFHAFMQEVQKGLHEARNSRERDALISVSKNMAQGLRILALDEMQIKDIADAMIVGRLFKLMHSYGVITVTTSNRKPDELYKNGLNRQLFLPFIDFLKSNLVVHKLDGGIDFRQNRISGREVYFSPINYRSSTSINEIWYHLTGGHEELLKLYVKGRVVDIPRYNNGVGRFGFYDLCGQPLGPVDYLALADNLRVIVIENIPQMGRNNYNEAKRFVTLIDALYEAKTRVICSAEVEPEFLYLEGESVFEFERTASRLREMQSAEWAI